MKLTMRRNTFGGGIAIEHKDRRDILIYITNEGVNPHCAIMRQLVIDGVDEIGN